MKNLFIDANIWLSLYHFSSDDLEQFSKLKELVGTDIRLFIPSQIRNEVQRNRDAKIKDALTKFEKFDFTFPAFCKSYDEYCDFSQKYSELKRMHKEWCKKVHEDISTQNLPADKVISEFFELCEIIECTPEMVRGAELRYKAGDPPGKDNKFGDAINWECLLSVVPDGEDLYFVSGDKDYASVVDDQRFNLFLTKEWTRKKTSKIIFFKSLVTFLSAHVKDIRLRTEQEKDDLISSLKHSHNFANTHAVIDKMSKYSDWSAAQIDEICSAALENSQVGWILGDDDVHDFYEKLLNNTKAESQNITEVKAMLVAPEEEEEDSSRQWWI